ncbi:MAG: protein arginine kinase [Oscillospiraceae bacterium]|nr:protein arginine kinase [Oscillospiraceae bacterium]
MSKWYINTGEHGDVVLSTRIRFARNLAPYPFPAKLPVSEKYTVNELVRTALEDVPALKLQYTDMNQINDFEAVSLAERHLVSPEFVSAREGRSLLLSEDESVSIMLNEEDHIRLQVIKGGFALDEAFSEAGKIDDLLDSRLQYAFDDRIGYLTQCPTNLGTGMRASVMLHLPALAACSQLASLSATVSKLGLTIRGSYGEGSSAKGDIYQLSNQVSLGISEQAALENLKSITLQLATRERTAREELEKNPAFLDKIFRSYGILKTARILSTDEMMELLSFTRLGSIRGQIPVKTEVINELFVTMQPANLNSSYKTRFDAMTRREVRAEAVRRALEESDRTD